jgi:adenylate cyclase, class 2
MLEVEVKYRADNWEPIQAQLLTWGALSHEPRQDVDQYFNAPDRDFAKTDEAVRLRRIGMSNYLTYKGPKREAETKTRKEIELAIAPGEAAAQLAVEWLTSLGYRSVAVVRKTRQIWTFHRGGFALEACFDRVDGVGQFVELEIQAEEAAFEAAKQVILQTAAELGLVQQERRSYLGLLLQSAGQA